MSTVFDSTNRLDKHGEVEQVFYNNQVRSRALTLEVDEMKATYDAMKTLDNLFYSDKYMLNYKLQDGDCVVFDNVRVLHGRKGYEISEASSRFYNGSYVSWDEVRSRMNVIKHLDNELKEH
jgi:gamma-butyrobetaine dioxygenase